MPSHEPSAVRSRPRRRACDRAAASSVAAIAALLAAALAGCAAPAPPSAPTYGSRTVDVAFDADDCGQGWSHPQAGPQTFRIRNNGTDGAEVDLIDPDTGGIYAEAENVGPGTTVTMPVDLGAGAYAFRCVIEDSAAVTGPTLRLTGMAVGTPAIVPVTRADLIAPAHAYTLQVRAALPTLAADTDTLAAAVHRGDLDAARAAWLPAHLDYVRLGAAYDAFGDLGDTIDGLPDGLPGGVDDPNFTGFHRVEYGLWHGQDAAALTGPVDTLDAAVHQLVEEFATTEIDAAELPLRAHEILEDTIRDQLTGHDDEGSDSDLATARASIDATRQVLGQLAPLLSERVPDWAQASAAVDRLQALLDAQHRPDGGWTALSALTPAQHEAIDAAADQAVELLATVATVGEPRRTS